jgi:amidohydrolase
VHAAGRLVAGLHSALPAPVGRVLLLTFASIEGGHAANIVAGLVTLRGTLRWDVAEDREAVLADTEAAVTAIAKDTGVNAQWRLTASVPPLSNDRALARVVAEAVAASGRAHDVDPGLLPFSDDFAHVAVRVPTCFFGVGAGGPAAPPHHHPAFDIDERAVDLTAEVLTRAALLYCRADRSKMET